jgi:hypothetical protein
LTIDLAAGDRWLIALTRKATGDWLNTTTPVLDYENAMVPARQPNSAANTSKLSTSIFLYISVFLPRSFEIDRLKGVMQVGES